MPARIIAIAVPTLGTIDVDVVKCLISLQRPLNATVTFAWPVGMDTATARTRTVEELRKTGCSHVFFVDYDVIVPREALTILAARELPVVCGLYYTKTKPPEPLTIVDGDVVTDWKMGQLVTVDTTGLGCALISLDVFDGLKEPWFQSGAEGSVRYTEDAWFFRQLREQKGIKPVVDTGVYCGHKNVTTGEVFFWDAETRQPAWCDPSGTKHTIAQAEVVDLTKESEPK